MLWESECAVAQAKESGLQRLRKLHQDERCCDESKNYEIFGSTWPLQHATYLYLSSSAWRSELKERGNRLS